MKTFLALCLLFAAANAFSLDALRNMLEEEEEKMDKREDIKEITLKEYLDNLETPDPLYRTLSRRQTSDCSSVCGPLPSVDHTGTCASNKWVPNYVAKGNCECLTEYKCCGNTCATANVESCWASGQKGLKYGIKEVDCCGCEVVKCLPCAAPTDEATLCPNTQCYTYNGQAVHQPVTGCFEAACPANPSDAPADESCDATCETPQSVASPCGHPYKICQGTKMIATCPRQQQMAAGNTPELPLNCYEAPTQVAHTSAGNYYDSSSDSCLPCQKWTYTKLSCASKNAAVDAADCHQIGANEFDKKCMRKDVSQDNCLCNKHVCVVDHSEPEAKFGEGEVCPKDHMKLSGVSICGVARDLCLPCPALVAKAQVPCTVGTVMTSADVNGCPVNVCQPPAIPSAACASNTFAYDSGNNQFTCVP